MPPINLEEALRRGLATESGVHTFSNGSHWEGWADGNCLECWYWPYEGPAGEYCAFEALAFMHQVSPELARLFGWSQDPKYDKPDDHRHGWDEPRQCPFFLQRPEGGEGDAEPPAPPVNDPAQLVLIADPAEAIAGVELTERLEAHTFS